MSKLFLISEEDAELILQSLIDRPYREVFKFCNVLLNLDPAPDIQAQVRQYHDFIVNKGLWEEFIAYIKWVPADLDEPTADPPADLPSP